MALAFWFWDQPGPGGEGLKNGDAKLCSGERENGKWDR